MLFCILDTIEIYKNIIGNLKTYQNITNYVQIVPKIAHKNILNLTLFIKISYKR